LENLDQHTVTSEKKAG